MSCLASGDGTFICRRPVLQATFLTPLGERSSCLLRTQTRCRTTEQRHERDRQLWSETLPYVVEACIIRSSAARSVGNLLNTRTANMETWKSDSPGPLQERLRRSRTSLPLLVGRNLFLRQSHLLVVFLLQARPVEKLELQRCHCIWSGCNCGTDKLKAHAKRRISLDLGQKRACCYWYWPVFQFRKYLCIQRSANPQNSITSSTRTPSLHTRSRTGAEMVSEVV